MIEWMRAFNRDAGVPEMSTDLPPAGGALAGDVF